MSGSVSPVYRREFAHVPDTALPELYINDNEYGANSAPNKVTSFVAFARPDTPSTLGSAVKMSDPTREEIQAQIAASEARGEIKVTRLEGRIETLGAILGGKMDSIKEDIQKADSYNRDTRLLTLGTIVAAAIALGGVFVAMATYGDALFGRGMNVRDAIQTTIKDTLEQIKKDAPKPQ